MDSLLILIVYLVIITPVLCYIQMKLRLLLVEVPTPTTVVVVNSVIPIAYAEEV